MERAPAAFFIHILAQNMHLILASNIKAGREVRMLKKLVWLMFLVLVTACSVVMGDLSDLIVNPTPVASETPALTEEIPTELPLPTEAVTPEATLVPTLEETLAPTVEPTEAETLAPSLEPTLTSTPTATLEPTRFRPLPPPRALPATATPTATALPFIYAIQADTPLFMQNFVHPTEACNWQGIAGQVFNSAKTPVANLVVKVTGTWQNKPLLALASPAWWTVNLTGREVMRSCLALRRCLRLTNSPFRCLTSGEIRSAPLFHSAPAPIAQKT